MVLLAVIAAAPVLPQPDATTDTPYPKQNDPPPDEGSSSPPYFAQCHCEMANARRVEMIYNFESSGLLSNHTSYYFGTKE